MRILHRVTVPTEFGPKFEKLGLDISSESIQTIGNDVFVVELSDTDLRWSAIAKIISKLDILLTSRTEFSAEELSNSDCLAFRSSHFRGFPMPSESFEYREITYDSSAFCSECGVGLKQVAPFRLSFQPKWGKKSSFQLHWVFDEFFVTTASYESVFAPFGLTYLPVLSNRFKEPIAGVVQLQFDTIADLEIPRDVKYSKCKTCGIKKYDEQFTGLWPSPSEVPAHLFKSCQFFGYGHEGSRAMFVSRELYNAMTEYKMNCRYWACTQMAKTKAHYR